MYTGTILPNAPTAADAEFTGKSSGLLTEQLIDLKEKIIALQADIEAIKNLINRDGFSGMLEAEKRRLALLSGISF